MRTTGVEGGEEREGQCVCRVCEKERWERAGIYAARRQEEDIWLGG